MDRFSAALGIVALFSSLGLVYFSRFLLRKHPKLTGEELEHRNVELQGVHRSYRIFNTLTLLGVGFFLFLLYLFNQGFWEKRLVVLFIPIFAVYALFDGMFAARTKVFPTTSRYDLNSVWCSYQRFETV
jgi:hypothetical protein